MTLEFHISDQALAWITHVLAAGGGFVAGALAAWVMITRACQVWR